MHGKHLRSLSLLRGIFGIFLPPPCWDLRLLGLIESCLYHLGLIVLAFVARPNFWVHQPSLARLLFHGLLMQALLYSIVESTFGLLFMVASAIVLCIRTYYRWSRGHIPFGVLSNGVLCWVSIRPSLLRFGWYWCIFVSPQHSAELIWLRVPVR